MTIWWSTIAPVSFAVALAGAVMFSSARSYDAARQAQTALAESKRSRIATEWLLRRVVDAESAQRGYLLTELAPYLALYQSAKADVQRALADVQMHHAGDATILVTVDELTRHARNRLNELATTVATHDVADHQGLKAMLVADQGQVTMQALRLAASTLLAAEDRHAAALRSIIDRRFERARLSLDATTLLALIWLIFFLRKNRALRRAQHEHGKDLLAHHDALELQVAASTAELRELIAHLQDIREELSPSALHSLGLRAAIEILVADFRQRSGVDVSLQIEDLTVEESSHIAVYRLVQECLNNLQQHAAAASASVVVRRAERELLVRVRDNGSGFDPARVTSVRHGLRKLQHRIEWLGGRLFVISAPGCGTEVEARLPIAAARS